MARLTERFPMSLPVDTIAGACRAALPGRGWRVMNDAGWAFLLKEQLDLVGVFFSYPVKFAVFLREGDDENETLVELTGTTLGFGPLPKGKLRKKAAALRAQIEAAVERR
jgi:hypothetical protein